MASLFSSCYPLTQRFDETIKIPKPEFMKMGCANKFKQVPLGEQRVPNKTYYVITPPRTEQGFVEIKKKRYNEIADDIEAMGMVYTAEPNNGVFYGRHTIYTGGKRKSQRRNKKTRKQRRKTRKHRTRRM